jgi:tetratricopeptide (TPR) repeat protein
VYAVNDTVPVATTSPGVAVASLDPTPATSNAAGNFSEQGETAFKAGDYKGAAYAWRHALVDDPQNPVMLMMLGQALFANGQFNEAAGATQAAMQMMPKDKWGVVVTNFRDLYGNAGDYTPQLRALEKAVKDKPEDPAQRFLLGFHYAYLGYPKQAVDQLDKVLELQPKDEASKQLRDEMKAKLGNVAPATSSARVPSTATNS